MNEYLRYALAVVAALALIGLSYWLIKVRPVYQRLKRSIRDKAKKVGELNEELMQANTYFQLKLAVGGNNHLPPLALNGATTVKMKLVRSGEYSAGVVEEEVPMQGELSRRVAQSGEKRIVRGIQYVPPDMISRAKELSDIIANGIRELTKLTFPSVKDEEWFQEDEDRYRVGELKPGRWGRTRHRIARVRYRVWRVVRALAILDNRIEIAHHPRGNTTRLRGLEQEWEKLIGYQRELLKLLQKLPGSAEFLDGIERARLKKKSEKDREEQAKARIEQVKDQLDEAIRYIRLRHSERSLSIGEAPVTAGAANLTFPMLKRYWERETAKFNEMVESGVAPTEIVAYVTTKVLPNLEGLFEEKAKAVAKAEFTAGECQGRLRGLSEEARRELAVPEFLKKAFEILESEIPVLWSEARWEEFDSRLKEVTESFEAGQAFLEEAAAWFKDIQQFLARLAGVKAKEARLKEMYGREVTPTAEWLRLQGTFEGEGLTLWSQAHFDELDAYFTAAEETFGQHQLKVSDSLSQADKEAGRVPPAEEIEGVQAKLAQIAAAGQATPSTAQPKTRRHHVNQPSQPLSGTLVPWTNRRGLTIQVDESRLDWYKEMDAREAAAEAANKK